MYITDKDTNAITKIVQFDTSYGSIMVPMQSSLHHSGISKNEDG